MNVIVTGIPHSGTSMVTKWLHDTLPGQLNLPKNLLHRHGYNTYESAKLTDGYNQAEFTKEFPKGSYLWKTVYLYPNIYEYKEILNPNFVVMVVRNPIHHGHSIAKRYNRATRRVAQELHDTYPYLVRTVIWLKTHVISAESLYSNPGAEKDRLEKFLHKHIVAWPQLSNATIDHGMLSFNDAHDCHLESLWGNVSYLTLKDLSECVL